MTIIYSLIAVWALFEKGRRLHFCDNFDFDANIDR